MTDNLTDDEQPIDRIKLIRERLTEALDPSELSIIDDSHLHADHEEARESGGGHFSIDITSTQFGERSAIERHKMIYMALGDAMGTEIHALSINAKTPEDDEAKEESEPSSA